MSHSLPRNSLSWTYFVSHSIGTRLRLLGPALAIVMNCMVSANGQTAEFTQNSPGSNTMTMQVPLRAYPGRGVSLPVSLYYSTKVWRIGFIKSIYSSYGLPRSAA